MNEKVKVVAKTDRVMTRLTNPENFALIEWLKAYKQQPGDTIHTLTAKAAVELHNPRINYNHVQQRMFEFNISLVHRGAGADNAAVIERLAKLESVLVTSIREQIKHCRDLGIEPHRDLMAFAALT